MKRISTPWVTLLAVLGTGIGLRALRVRPAFASDVGTVLQLIMEKVPQLDGKNLTATTVEVGYPPGADSQPHSHSCPVFAYVVEGTIESQVKDQPVASYSAGQTYDEPLRGVHAISRAAIDTMPARLLP